MISLMRGVASNSERMAMADTDTVEPSVFNKLLGSSLDGLDEASHPPVFEFAKSKLSDVLGSSIKWNWTKFLFDRHGAPVRRFSPPVLDALRPAIEELLR